MQVNGTNPLLAALASAQSQTVQRSETSPSDGQKASRLRSFESLDRVNFPTQKPTIKEQKNPEQTLSQKQDDSQKKLQNFLAQQEASTEASPPRDLPRGSIVNIVI